MCVHIHNTIHTADDTKLLYLHDTHTTLVLTFTIALIEPSHLSSVPPTLKEGPTAPIRPGSWRPPGTHPTVPPNRNRR